MIADETVAMAKQLGLSSKVWTQRALKGGGFGGILGVGAGSANEPRLVELAYRGAGRAPAIAVTGKGVTFDSGGLNVKRTSEMAWMRSDKAGGAAALATVRAVAELGLTRQRRRGGAVRREHARRKRDPPRRRRASPRRPDVGGPRHRW